MPNSGGCDTYPNVKSTIQDYMEQLRHKSDQMAFDDTRRGGARR